jgi:AmmeMemoRadiSam system protein B
MDAHPSRVRSPAVAGLFYPNDPDELSAAVDSFLSGADARGAPATVQRDSAAPKALIVPHAGYIYSGPIAARAYRALGVHSETLRRIVLIGPSHHVGFEGVAIPSVRAFLTPVGEMTIDADALERLRALPTVVESDQPHALEHSLEVQLPFLQRVAPAAEIVPIVAGDATASEAEDVIDALWGGPETLIVISSDLSHYHPYAMAQAQDESTARAILEERDDIRGDQACGCVGINGLSRVARKRGMRTEILDLRNSGDTAGDKRRVVGYGAFGFYDA